ncbi:MAG TPA: nucleoside-diphosphate kinase [Bryobacterales bacterium]|nr:nucleoside-diphosphate kinase [Bryobacterales bacterium]
MAIQRTFTIIKPDATAAGHVGEIITELERAGFRILALKKLHLTRAQAEGFYAVHSHRPFFESLVTFMTEGEIVPIALERDNAITALRDLMGPTNASEAPPETIRGKFGTSIERNAIHGSDAPETAAVELAFFFSRLELDR